jgi:hypothetical protein
MYICMYVCVGVEKRQGKKTWNGYYIPYFPVLHDLTQIAGTRAEPQQIVAQRLLSCLQYPVPFKSSTKDLNLTNIVNCVDI